METQQDMVLHHLLKHGLGGHVYFLRRKGWKIRTERRQGDSGGMYAVYHLDIEEQ